MTLLLLMAVIFQLDLLQHIPDKAGGGRLSECHALVGLFLVCVCPCHPPSIKGIPPSQCPSALGSKRALELIPTPGRKDSGQPGPRPPDCSQGVSYLWDSPNPNAHFWLQPCCFQCFSSAIRKGFSPFPLSLALPAQRLLDLTTPGGVLLVILTSGLLIKHVYQLKGESVAQRQSAVTALAAFCGISSWATRMQLPAQQEVPRKAKERSLPLIQTIPDGSLDVPLVYPDWQQRPSRAGARGSSLP